MARIALVVLDTLRFDAFQRHFDWLPGQRYANAWSPSHGTVPVHGSLFTGVYPSEHGVQAKSPTLSTPEAVLPEQLNEAGFTTRAWSANPYVSPGFNFDRGFEHFGGNHRVRREFEGVFNWGSLVTETAPGATRFVKGLAGALKSDRPIESVRQGLLFFAEGRGLWEPTDSGGQSALEWVRKQRFGDEDEFLFMNLMDAHSPYLEIPEKYRPDVDPETVPRNPNIVQVFDQPEPEPVREAYDAAVAYLSDIYEEIFAVLEGEMDLVITLGDHGEALGEDGIWGHSYGLQPELTHVPLVVSGDTPSEEERTGVANFLDVCRTIQKYAGVDVNARGRSLLDADRDEDDRSYLTEYHGLPLPIIERLRDEYDVEQYEVELRGIVTDAQYGYQSVEGWKGDDDPALQEQLDALVSDLEKSQRRQPTEIDEGTLQQLQDMGYA